MDHRHSKVFQDVLDRLARVEGHVRAVRRMWEEGKPCPALLTQIAAVRAALDQVGRIVLESHIEECVVSAVEEGRGKETIEELKEALNRFI